MAIPSKNPIGSNLRHLVDVRGITQKELSMISGVGEVSISRYIHGQRRPRLDSAAKLADALGVDVSELIDPESDDLQAAVDLVCARYDELDTAQREVLLRALAR